jgi:hypothetical protein
MTAYQIWEFDTNELMLAKYGVGIDDIPDMPWHDWFTSDWSPREAMEEAIEKVNNEGF